MLVDWSREELVSRVISGQTALVQSEENVQAWQTYAHELKEQGRALYDNFVVKCHRLQRASHQLQEERERCALAQRAREAAELLVAEAKSQAKQQKEEFKKHFDSYAKLKVDIESTSAANRGLEARCRDLELKLASAPETSSISYPHSPSAEAETLRIRCEALRARNVSVLAELESERELVLARETQLSTMQLSFQQRLAEQEEIARELRCDRDSLAIQNRNLREQVALVNSVHAAKMEESAVKAIESSKTVIDLEESLSLQRERSDITIQELTDQVHLIQQEKHQLRLDAGALRAELASLQDDMKTLYKKHQVDLAGLGAKYQHENYKYKYERLAVQATQLESQRDGALSLLADRRGGNSTHEVELDVELARWMNASLKLSSQVAALRQKNSRLQQESKRSQNCAAALLDALREAKVQNSSQASRIKSIQAEALARLVVVAEMSNAETKMQILALDRSHRAKQHSAEIRFLQQSQLLTDTVAFVEQESIVKTEQIAELEGIVSQLQNDLSRTQEHNRRLREGMLHQQSCHQHELSLVATESAQERQAYIMQLRGAEEAFDAEAGQIKGAWALASLETEAEQEAMHAQLNALAAEVTKGKQELAELAIELVRSSERCDEAQRANHLLDELLQESRGESLAIQQEVRQILPLLHAARVAGVAVASDAAAVRAQCEAEKQLLSEASNHALQALRDGHAQQLAQLQEQHEMLHARQRSQMEALLSTSETCIRDLEVRVSDLSSGLAGATSLWMHWQCSWRREVATAEMKLREAEALAEERQQMLLALQPRLHAAEMNCDIQARLLHNIQEREEDARHAARGHFEAEAARLRGLKVGLENQVEQIATEKRALHDSLTLTRQQLDLARVAHAELLLQLEYFLASTPSSLLSTGDRDTLTWQRHRTTLQLKLQQQEGSIRQLQQLAEEVRSEAAEKEENWKEQARLIRASAAKADEKVANLRTQLARVAFLVQRALGSLPPGDTQSHLLQSALAATESN